MATNLVAIPSLSKVPEDLSDRLDVPHPELTQRITFEGGDCVVMAPEDYTRLYQYADRLEEALYNLETQVTLAARYRDKGGVVTALVAARTVLVDGGAV